MISVKLKYHTMELVKEYLERSTIHGLAYISASDNRLIKLLWIMVVVAGFSLAGYLINNSYSDWNDSPISSVISTHPVKDLSFPKVTVCPPKKSNTALTYDIVKSNKTF